MPFFLCTGFFCCCYCYSCAHISCRAIFISKLREGEKREKKIFPKAVPPIPRRPNFFFFTVLCFSSIHLLYWNNNFVCNFFPLLCVSFASFSFFFSSIHLLLSILVPFRKPSQYYHIIYVEFIQYDIHFIRYCICKFFLLFLLLLTMTIVHINECHFVVMETTLQFKRFFAFWVTVFISLWRIFMFFVDVSVLSFCFVLFCFAGCHIQTSIYYFLYIFLYLLHCSISGQL